MLHIFFNWQPSFYMFFITALPVALMLIGGRLSRIDGAILIAVFIGYFYFLIRERTRFRKEIEDGIGRKGIVVAVFSFIICLFI